MVNFRIFVEKIDSLDEMINKDPDFQDKDELSFDDGDSAYDQFIKEKKVQEEEKKNENMQDKELDKMLQRRAFDNVKEEDFSKQFFCVPKTFFR